MSKFSITNHSTSTVVNRGPLPGKWVIVPETYHKDPMAGLNPSHQWQARADFVISWLCLQVYNARRELVEAANSVQPFLTVTVGSFESWPSVRNRLVQFQQLHNNVTRMFHSDPVEMACGPWPCIDATSFMPRASAGFTAFSPTELRTATEPLSVLRSLYEAMHEISPLGKPLGYEWHELDIEFAATIYPAALSALQNAQTISCTL